MSTAIDHYLPTSELTEPLKLTRSMALNYLLVLRREMLMWEAEYLSMSEEAKEGTVNP